MKSDVVSKQYSQSFKGSKHYLVESPDSECGRYKYGSFEQCSPAILCTKQSYNYCGALLPHTMPTEPSNKSNKGSESTSKSNVISQYLPFVSNALADGGDRVPVNSMSDQVADVIEETRTLSQSAMSISDMREQILGMPMLLS